MCVPVRPTPQLGQTPWMLPANIARKDFLLSPANEFSGMPDPTDPMGNVQDVAIGLSRTFLDLVGFHVYNSGTLCLDIGGSAIPQLNAGTLSVIVGSLGNIIEDRKAPLELVLRPQTPLTFTVGAGDMTDPLIHIGISDMRIDFYAWMEERWVRLLTMGVDLNVGAQPDRHQGRQRQAGDRSPCSSASTPSNVTIRVSNTDLLQETPDALQQVFPSLINIATGALGGVIKPIALPSVAGFSLDNLQIQRVQTSQDDFVAIYGSIITGTPAPLIDWSNPNAPRTITAVQRQRGGRRGARCRRATSCSAELRREQRRRHGRAPDGEAGARHHRQRRARRRVRLAHRRRHVAPVDAGRQPDHLTTTPSCSRVTTPSTCARASSTIGRPSRNAGVGSTCSSTRWRRSCTRRATRRTHARSTSAASTSSPTRRSFIRLGSGRRAAAPSSRRRAR